MSKFIEVTLDASKIPDRGENLVRICPVDSFAWDDSANYAILVPENFDECTLCDLCLQACPDAVGVNKLY